MSVELGNHELQDGIDWVGRIDYTANNAGALAIESMLACGLVVITIPPEEVSMLQKLHDVTSAFSELPLEIRDWAKNTNQDHGSRDWGRATSSPGNPDLNSTFVYQGLPTPGIDRHPILKEMWLAHHAARLLFCQTTDRLHQALMVRFGDQNSQPLKRRTTLQTGTYYLPTPEELRRYNQHHGLNQTLEDIEADPLAIKPHDDWSLFSFGAKARSQSAGVALEFALAGGGPDDWLPVRLAENEIVLYPSGVMAALTAEKIPGMIHRVRSNGWLWRNAILGFDDLDTHVYDGAVLAPLVKTAYNQDVNVVEVGQKVEQEFQFKPAIVQ
jgi:hypothetical protein